MNCPICSNQMVLRTARKSGNQFWGCKSFPKCRGTKSYTGNGIKNLSPIKRELKSIPNPSKYQQDIFDTVKAILNGENDIDNLIINATAGSGKTSVCEHLTGLIKSVNNQLSQRYLVYNTRVAKEAQSKGLPAKTTHSEYFASYRKANGKVKIDNFKVNNIVKDLLHDDYGNDIESVKWMIYPVSNIIGKIKNTLSDTDDNSLMEITMKFNIDINNSEDVIFDLVRRGLAQNNKTKNIIDFDDMLYMTYSLNIPVEKYDWILGDEVQDWNAVQIELVKRSVKPDGHVILVGDRNQAMYGFRGAEINSIDILKSAFDAKEMPLSITYRCPKSHVQLVNEKFPSIKFEPYEKAIDGEIITEKIDLSLSKMQDGDLVLCRTNAPLVKPAFELIRQGVKAVILGRDIGTNLINIVKKHEKKTLIDTINKIAQYGQREYQKLIAYQKTGQAETLKDKIETITIISESCDTVQQLIKKIDSIFSDNLEGVTFSTVHKAKGGEADNVYILTESPMPHPMAKNPNEKVQEQNILFVALTRSKKTLTFVK